MKYLILSVFLFLAACQTSPTGRKQLALASDEQMEEMGRQAFAEMKAKQTIEDDAATNSYVQCVARAITANVEPKRDWEVVVFRDKQVNAFALPGGKIGVYTGLLGVAKNQHQLATVLGHEVGHVIAGHGKERVSEQMVAEGGLAAAGAVLGSPADPRHKVLLGALGIGAQVGVLLPHSRAQESEADVIGLDLMARSGFVPAESVALWRNMQAANAGAPPEFLSTHPSDESRIRTLEEKLPAARQVASASPRHPACAGGN